jgi:hypothetical protein
MSVSFQLDIKDSATPAVREKIEKCSPRRLHEAIGPAASQLVKRHFVGLPSNKQDYPSTGFWEKAAYSTSYQLVPEGTVISIAKQGVRQRLQGGTIKPVNKKYLALPANSEAYGHKPSEFSTLKVFWGRDKTGTVRPMGLKLADNYGVEKTVTKGKHAGEKKFKQLNEYQIGSVYFWFVTEVHQDPNPNVLPDKLELQRTVTIAAAEAVK